MKRFIVAMSPVLAVAALISGCEWSSSGGGESWNDSWSWVDFSGTYRAEGGGVLVSGHVHRGGAGLCDLVRLRRRRPRAADAGVRRPGGLGLRAMQYCRIAVLCLIG